VQWTSPDETRRLPFGERSLTALAAEADLCVGGDGLAWLHTQGLLMECVHTVRVFARATPDQKELVLGALKAAGLTTLMCGDGTNDVGALKMAHCGVALLQVGCRWHIHSRPWYSLGPYPSPSRGCTPTISALHVQRLCAVRSFATCGLCFSLHTCWKRTRPAVCAQKGTRSGNSRCASAGACGRRRAKRRR
jgi:hypothetical protein